MIKLSSIQPTLQKESLSHKGYKYANFIPGFFNMFLFFYDFKLIYQL